MDSGLGGTVLDWQWFSRSSPNPRACVPKTGLERVGVTRAINHARAGRSSRSYILCLVTPGFEDFTCCSWSLVRWDQHAGLRQPAPG
jgi:hypothetical protein